MNQIKKNLIYNIFYQILILILPLITIPYVSRVLGVEGVGIYSYTYSIVNYFMLISLLGINNYGNRTIAKVRDNRNELSENFIGIYIIQFTMSLIMLAFYLLYSLLFGGEYRLIFMLEIMYLLSAMFDINWFFFGLEKFKITVIRSTSLKLLSLILIFIFVRDSGDVWKYVLILSLSTFLSQLLLIPFLVKEIDFVKINFNKIKKHIKPILILFIPVIAISLYKLMDKVMIGILANVIEVGYYEQAEKIINVPMGIVTALGTVMLPRISNLAKKGNDNQIKIYIKKSISFMMFLAIPITLGLIAVSSDFVPLFLGEDFMKTSIVVYYIAVTILFISFANVIRTQYLIPKEKDNIYIKSVIGGAIINLIINYILIPKFQSIGAAIGTILAEFFVMYYQTMAIRKELPIGTYLKITSLLFLKGLIMFVIVLLIKFMNISGILRVLMQIFIGSVVYFILNLKYINEILDLKGILNRIKKCKPKEENRI